MLVHATGESLVGPHGPNTFAVVLVARDELHLALVATELDRRGIACARVREPDAPWNGALMAVGVAPGRREVLRRALSSLPLLR